MPEEFDETLERFLREKKIHRFEGDSGLKNLETLFSALGYTEHGFRFGNLIEVFLSDNPGACDAIVEWIRDQNNPEWHECLTKEIDDEEYEPDGDGDNVYRPNHPLGGQIA